ARCATLALRNCPTLRSTALVGYPTFAGEMPGLVVGSQVTICAPRMASNQARKPAAAAVTANPAKAAGLNELTRGKRIVLVPTRTPTAKMVKAMAATSLRNARKPRAVIAAGAIRNGSQRRSLWLMSMIAKPPYLNGFISEAKWKSVLTPRAIVRDLRLSSTLTSAARGTKQVASGTLTERYPCSLATSVDAKSQLRPGGSASERMSRRMP